MEIVPVLDLKGGVVVHARRGRRAEYVPVRSSLVDGSEPVTVARALCVAGRARRLYVADLDALAGEPADAPTLSALAAVAEAWVDAGATTGERAAVLARAGVARNVIGTESLGTADAPWRAVRRATGGRPPGGPGPRLVLSVDLRDGRLVSPRPELAGHEPVAVVPTVRALGVSELVVIDLARVGSASGPPLAAVADLAAALPDVAIYAGGGVRDASDLRALEAAGATGALVATALHECRLIA
jgi:phosphoribosylformimino-5-aminoimidazole carboxamide ribotide isomerase